MKKKLVCLVVGMLVCVSGCGNAQNSKETTETITTQENFKQTVADTKKETQETTEELLSYQDVNLSGKADIDFEILSVASGTIGPIVKVDFAGEEKKLTLDFEYDGYGIDLSSYEFEIADVDQDGKDDVLVKMYYPNNIVESLHIARLYHVENGEFVLWSDLNKEFVDEIVFLDESKIEASKVTLVTFYPSYDAEGEMIICDDTIVLKVVDGELEVSWE